MVLLVVLTFVLWLSTGALCKQEFINPPPFAKPGVYTGNTGYVEGSRVNILWSETEPGKKCSLVLYQVNKTSNEHFGDWEFLTRDVVDVTSYSWLVGTDKDLGESEVFFLSYYQEGKTVSSMDSRYFNITAQIADPDPPLPSKAPPSSKPSATPEPEAPESDSESTTKSSPTATISRPPASSSTDKPTDLFTSLSSNPSNSTSTSNNQSSTPISTAQPSSSPSDTPTSPDPPRITITAIVGICVGVLVFLLLVLLTIYLCLRRRRALASAASSQHSLTQDDGYYRPDLPEAPCRSPKEMGQLPGLWTTHPELPIRSPGELGSNGELWTGRPELPNGVKSPVELGDNKGLWTGRPELPGDRHASVHTVRYELES